MNPVRTGIVVALVALLAATLLFVHRVETGGDNLDFLMLAKSLQQHQWTDAFAWPRPPGYAAFLAVLLGVAGYRMDGAMFWIEPAAFYMAGAANAVVFALAAAAVYAWALRVVRRKGLAAWIGLLFATNQILAARSTVISAEPLLMMLTYAALALWERDAGEKKPACGRLFAFAALASLAMYVKFQGLALAPALALWILVFWKTARPRIPAAAIVGAFAALALVLQWYTNRFCLTHVVASDPYGLGHAVSWGARLRNAAVVYSWGGADFAVPKILEDYGLLDLVGLGSLSWQYVALIWLLIAIGLVVTVRGGVRLSHFYLLGFGAMLLAWPDFVSRYLTPVVPIGLWLLLEGIDTVAAGWARLIRGRAAPVPVWTAAILGALLAWGVAVDLFAGAKNWRNIVALRDLPPWAPERYVISREDDFADYMAAGRWLGSNTPPGAVVFCRKALFTELAARRHCEYYSSASTPDELWQRIVAASRTDPVFVLKDNFAAESTYGRIRELRLLPALRAHAGDLEPLYRTEGGSIIYRIARPIPSTR